MFQVLDEFGHRVIELAAARMLRIIADVVQPAVDAVDQRSGDAFAQFLGIADDADHLQHGWIFAPGHFEDHAGQHLLVGGVVQQSRTAAQTRVEQGLVPVIFSQRIE